MNSQIKNRQRKLTDQVHNATFKKKQTVISVMKGNYCKNNGSLLVCKKTYKNYNDHTTNSNRDLLLKSIKDITELLRIKELDISRISKETTKKESS